MACCHPRYTIINHRREDRTMSQERITTLLNENRSYLPPEHGKTSAWVCGPEEYNALCRRALEDPNDFWGARASQLIHWFKRWDKVL